MKITVYQIVPELDNDHLMFRGAELHQNSQRS